MFPSGLGGVFVMKEGKATLHVMRDFSAEPINNEEQLDKWLKFFNMSAPLVAVGTLISADPVRYFNYICKPHHVAILLKIYL